MTDTTTLQASTSLQRSAGAPVPIAREVIATPYTDVPMEPGQAFRLEPLDHRAEAEETFVLTARGAEVVTADRLEEIP